MTTNVSTRRWSPIRALAGLLIATALLLGLQVPMASANAKMSASSVGSKPVGQTTYVWGSTSGFQHQEVTVSTQVLINGSWSTSQQITSDGHYSLPLTYGVNQEGTYTYRVVATDGATTATSDTFTLERTAPEASVTAASAGTKAVGENTNVWGSVTGFGGSTVTVSTQVLINGSWSTSQRVNATGSYVLPLSYGSSSVGTYTYRVVASNGYYSVTSQEFTLERTPRPTVTASSAGSKTVGEATNVWGTAAGFAGSEITVSTQVLINGSWSTSQRTTTSGYYVLPLTYGINTAGTYTFRVVASDGSATAYSPSFTLKRESSLYGRYPASVWAALAECESGGDPAIVSSNGLHHGLYQFRVDTWYSVGGTGLPSRATPDEQTRRAVILQERSGWGQWPACSRMLGLR